VKNKILRAKQFIHRHRDGYFWITGAITGAGITYLVMQSQHGPTCLTITREQLMGMLNDPNAMMLWDNLPKRQIIHLHHALNQ
jgi:hypothetical protein